MKKPPIKILVETAMLLALLLCVQYVTGALIAKPFQQYVTGSCVNCILAVTVLLCGYGSGITVALLSPVFAYLFGIAPQLVTVPAIMAGNAVFVVVLKLITGKALWRQIAAVAVSGLVKFGVLYFLVVQVICNLAAGYLMEQALLKAPMVANLTVMFAWPQLFTALIGGALAMVITPILKKALKR